LAAVRAALVKKACVPDPGNLQTSKICVADLSGGANHRGGTIAYMSVTDEKHYSRGSRANEGYI